MKTKIFRSSLICLALLTCGGSLFAQETVTTLPPVTVTANSNVTKKVAQAFETTFKEAYHERWYKADKNYLVNFIMNDQKNHALFTKNGSIIYHITYGFESNLPDDIRKMVKTGYLDYTITSAINVKQEGRDIWVVNMEDAKNLILVRVENGEMEEAAKYDKP